ncbi:hypothetical protein EI94DRAFT_1687705 [Lactarius quietus]|nr:hypothetical protein EI94DRAFT_1687705 [Lactarius quietus]
MTRKSRRRNKSQGADIEAQPEDGLREVRQQVAHEMSILRYGRRGEPSGGAGSKVLVEEGDREGLAGSSTQPQAHLHKDGPSESNSGEKKGEHENVQSDDRSPSDTAQPTPPEMPRMIGDFDDNANAMWSLHLAEAKNHDEGRINSLKNDMDSVLIFAGLFSAALTSFLADSIDSLQVDPAQQMVYYQQQNVALLAQISKQVSSITPQVSIPSALPPPYPDFRPNPSDVRVNAFWFMSLVFSLFAALLAILVQQWVRDYMHVFQRYSNPLKSARLRQYLYEGLEGWYMPLVAESVPGLVHISLFLFFVGLGDSLLAVNTAVAVTTIIPITIFGLLYLLSTFASVINPQSPFQNPFTGLIWRLKQKMHPRRYLDRASGGSFKAVSSNLSEGQMQLAMEENDERKYRDVRAIQWLIPNRTEDDEMESFVMAIPGCFTSKWGTEVWTEVKQYEDTNLTPNGTTVGSQSDADSRTPHHFPPHFQRTSHPLSLGRIIGKRIANGATRDVSVIQTISHPPSDNQALDHPHTRRDLAIDDLCKRVRLLVGTCNNHSLFSNTALWLKRTRGCVETAASLMLCADIPPELFGNLEKLLPPLRKFVIMEARQISAPGSDGLFRSRFECLSFVFANRGMSNRDGMQLNARLTIDSLSRFGMEVDGEQVSDGDGDEIALRNARRIDNYFETARQFCVYGLRKAISPSGVEMPEDQAREVLGRDHEADISMLERIGLETASVANIDKAMFETLHMFSHGLISYVRGAHFDIPKETELLQPIQFFNPHKFDEMPIFLPQFIYLHQRLRFLCSYSSKLRDVIDGRGNGAYYDEIVESLKTLWSESDKPTCKWSGVRRRCLMERQLWRLQDLRDSGGFGFWVELFFLMAQQLLVVPLSSDAHSSLTVGTFRTITADWRQHKHSIGTQRVILNLVCDIAISGHGLLSDLGFPRYIANELLALLKNMLEGQSGSYIDEAMKELEDAKLEDAIEEQGHAETCDRWTEIRPFREEAIKVISLTRANTFVA